MEQCYLGVVIHVILFRGLGSVTLSFIFIHYQVAQLYMTNSEFNGTNDLDLMLLGHVSNT